MLKKQRGSKQYSLEPLVQHCLHRGKILLLGVSIKVFDSLANGLDTFSLLIRN